MSGAAQVAELSGRCVEGGHSREKATETLAAQSRTTASRPPRAAQTRRPRKIRAARNGILILPPQFAEKIVKVVVKVPGSLRRVREPRAFKNAGISRP